MRAAGIALVLAAILALTSGCQTEGMVRNAEHESLYGTPRTISANWDMTRDSNQWRPWER
jgi:hypothetical protein